MLYERSSHAQADASPVLAVGNYEYEQSADGKTLIVLADAQQPTDVAMCAFCEMPSQFRA
jgi:hypothetical protein